MPPPRGAGNPRPHSGRPRVRDPPPAPLRARFGAGLPKHRVWLVTLDGWDGKPELQEWLAANTVVVGEVPASWSRQRVYIHAVIAPARAARSG